MFLSKDFIETAEGLVFAVVEHGLEQGRVLCFLRYVREGSTWQKYSTLQANSFLQSTYPQYLYYSIAKDVHLHAVPPAKIVCHHQPRPRLQTLLHSTDLDAVESDLKRLCVLYRGQGLNMQALGVTGSLLIGAQKPNSDIDLVVYGREHFFQARSITQRLLAQHELQSLQQQAWLSTYQRRSCELTLEEYIWHERRKFNKALVNNRKFDISLIADETQAEPIKFNKQGRITIRALVADDSHAYDYPARFIIDHELANECVSYTATYTGQAVSGECIEISGFLEISEQGVRRMVVGSSREAQGEYIKVIR